MNTFSHSHIIIHKITLISPPLPSIDRSRRVITPHRYSRIIFSFFQRTHLQRKKVVFLIKADTAGFFCILPAFPEQFYLNRNSSVERGSYLPFLDSKITEPGSRHSQVCHIPLGTQIPGIGLPYSRRYDAISFP